MADRTVGDTVTASNNVTNATAAYSSIGSAEAASSAGDTITVIRNDNVQSTGITVDVQVTIAAHALCDTPDGTEDSIRAGPRIDTSDSPMMTLRASGIVVSGLGFVQGGSRGIEIPDNVDVTIQRCGFVDAGTCDVAIFNISDGDCTVSNCYFIGDFTATQDFFGTGWMKMYHCSAYGTAGAAYQYRRIGSTVECYACIALGTASTANFSGTIGGNFNVSDDATAPGAANAQNEAASDWFDVLTGGSEDLRLDANRKGWWAANKDAIDQTGWPADVGTDIVGTSRAAPIDPGVWQTPAAAAATSYPFSPRYPRFSSLLRR